MASSTTVGSPPIGEGINSITNSDTTAAVVNSPAATAAVVNTPAAVNFPVTGEDSNRSSNGRPNKKQKNDSNSNSGGDHRKEREEWSDAAIEILLDSYIQKFTALNRNNLRGKDWETVVELVSEGCDKKSRKSIEQCKNKVDNLKKRYKLEIQRMESTNSSTSNWIWFKKMEAIVGNVTATKSGTASDDDRSHVVSSAQRLRRSASKTSLQDYRSTHGEITQGTILHSLYDVHMLAPHSASVLNHVNSKPVRSLKWKRVVFKVSGTGLSGSGQSIDPKVALQVAEEVATAVRLGVEVAIIVGGRNFFCGDSWVSATDLDRPTAYQIGMMATVMNSVLLQSALEKLGIQTHVQSALAMPEVAEPYNRLRAMRHLDKGRVVIFGGIGAGTGNPLFTTDTAAALRASEINADAVLKGTNVDGIFNNNDVLLNQISFREVVSKDVASMDLMAIQFCEENGIPVVIFNMLEPGNVSRALIGEQVGTLIDQYGTMN